VTADDVDLMRWRQRDTCPICLRPLPAKAHVDHDHETGEVRGLHCFTCNVGLGNFSDDTRRMLRAVQYLKGTLNAPSWTNHAPLWSRPESRAERHLEALIFRQVGSPP
jgi:hypothetical protein